METSRSPAGSRYRCRDQVPAPEPTVTVGLRARAATPICCRRRVGSGGTWSYCNRPAGIGQGVGGAVGPFTWIEPAPDSVTVRVSDCPAEMLLELAVMGNGGTEAAALAANAEIANETEETCQRRKRPSWSLPYLDLSGIAPELSGEDPEYSVRLMRAKRQTVGAERRMAESQTVTD